MLHGRSCQLEMEMRFSFLRNSDPCPDHQLSAPIELDPDWFYLFWWCSSTWITNTVPIYRSHFYFNNSVWWWRFTGTVNSRWKCVFHLCFAQITTLLQQQRCCITSAARLNLRCSSIAIFYIIPCDTSPPWLRAPYSEADTTLTSSTVSDCAASPTLSTRDGNAVPFLLWQTLLMMTYLRHYQLSTRNGGGISMSTFAASSDDAASRSRYSNTDPTSALTTVLGDAASPARLTRG